MIRRAKKVLLFWCDMIGKGRQLITTTYKTITRDNIFEVIQQALILHQSNADDCDYLLDYDAGVQPLNRDKCEKKVMPWINVDAVDNVAHEISDFWVGFGWGNPIVLVQRGENADAEKARGIALVNNGYSAAGNSRDLQKIANFVVKCGHCYTLSEINKDWEEGEAYFTRDVLDPRSSFIVYSSSYPDGRAMLGVTYATDDNGMSMTAYTKDTRYTLYATRLNNRNVTKGDKYWQQAYDWKIVSEDYNYLQKIAIVEWYWTIDRSGVFEHQISALDNVNLLVSDIANGFEQNIQAIWWSNNVEFPTEITKDAEGNEIEVIKKPKSGEWVMTSSSKDSSQPSIQALTIDYHLEDMQRSYTEQRSLILQKCHVPQRSETSGGSSGVAMDSAAGWADAESVASAREELIKACQLDELRVVLRAIKESPDIDPTNPMLKLYVNDIQPAVRRPKNFDLATKANSIATLISHGFALEDILANIPLFNDATQTIERSGEGVRKYQESIISGAEEESRNQQDMSDNAQNSPLLSND